MLNTLLLSNINPPSISVTSKSDLKQFKVKNLKLRKTPKQCYKI